MGDEYLETQCKLLKITLDKMMCTNDLYKLRCMFEHSADRLRIIYIQRHKKLLEKDVTKDTVKITKEYLNNVYGIQGFVYADTDSIKVEKEETK